jgi:hypothetical protein
MGLTVCPGKKDVVMQCDEFLNDYLHRHPSGRPSANFCRLMVSYAMYVFLHVGLRTQPGNAHGSTIRARLTTVRFIPD